ncbi:DJ-1/PfpI family protein [Halopseudomonas phragmitis]|uniref:Glutamine amidotransferase n=2 Tax=Pseudomonadaceae TaxID=135621 RepID=A0A1V0B432_9GAMM|nr:MULTISPECIES: DJ-1/PfpI family protein [Pseudomonadaceae]AQZ94677.1 glutamine amidotransferase [Halopseudomonas phragmitis]RHW22835.1 DJ-1/PfpI family protein [Pseudomonas jilinensis]
MNVGIYIYDHAEVLDFSGPFEVFSTASRLSEPKGLFKVFLLAETLQPVNARGGFSVNPQYALSDHPALDVLIVAGGVHSAELHKPGVIAWVAEQARSVPLVASVCTGAFILAQAGVLDGLEVTTHWEDIADLRHDYPALTVCEGRRWVDTGKLVTSGGISAGIDMSLHLVSRLGGMALAQMTARQMEFDWSNG